MKIPSKLINILLPPLSKRRKNLKNLLAEKGIRAADNTFNLWIKSIEPQSFSKKTNLSYQPLISVVTIVDTFNEGKFYTLILSIINQTYQNWELIIISTPNNKEKKNRLKKLVMTDPRINVVESKSKNEPNNKNLGLHKGKGSYICFVNEKDLISPHALKEVVLSLQNPKERPTICYSDEDEVTYNDSQRLNPNFKPGWSPDMLRFTNYMGNLMVIDRKLAINMGGFNKGLNEAHIYDFVLRLCEAEPKIKHIPKILYHHRKDLSTTHKTTNDVKDSSEFTEALKSHLKRLKVKAAIAVIPHKPLLYRISYQFTERHNRVAILITNQLHDDLVERVRTDIENNTDYKNYEIKVWDNINDIKTALQKHSHIVLINDYIKPYDTGWLGEVVGLSNQPHVGFVSPRVFNENFAVEDVGLLKKDNGWEFLFSGIGISEDTYFCAPDWPRNLTYLSGRIFAIQSKKLLKLIEPKHVRYGELFGVDPELFKKASDQGLFNVVWTHVGFIKLGPGDKLNQDNFLNPNIVFESPMRAVGTYGRYEKH